MESMDRVDSDSSGIQSTTSVDDVSSSYTASYLKSFLPAYQVVNQSAISGVAERYRAIKFAADASLAFTASGAGWSDALSKMLVEVEGDASSHSSSDEVEFSRTSDAGHASSSVSISSHQQSPDIDSNDICERSVPSEIVSWGRKLGLNSLYHRKAIAGGRKFVFQRLAGRGCKKNLRGHQGLSRDASRLAILRTLSTKCESKRGLRRFSSRPRAVVRKVKSLGRTRRRLPRFPKPLESAAEPEERFQNGLVALQRLVPGGSDMDAAVLLDEAADFVMFLKLQVQALQSVANAVGVEACNIGS